jgi:hypothetical protein
MILMYFILKYIYYFLRRKSYPKIEASLKFDLRYMNFNRPQHFKIIVYNKISDYHLIVGKFFSLSTLSKSCKLYMPDISD